MAKEIPENEINSFLENLRTAQRDGSAWGFLGKGRDATRNLSMLGQNAISAVGLLGGRAIYHADRLLEHGRSNQEKNFALALVNSANELMGSMEEERVIRSVVSGEGSDCCLWWTLSPYIFEKLKPKVGEREAVRLLLEWSKTGIPVHEIKGQEVNLQGLDVYNYASRGLCTFTLSLDPKGLSHQFAKEEAQRLIRDTFRV